MVTHQLQIEKNSNGDWAVTNPGTVSRTDTLIWTLDPNSSVEARFQFPLANLVTGEPLSSHRTAEILVPGGTLELVVHSEAPTGAHHYSVWIKDENESGGGCFAIGNNPPPEIDVGG